MRQSDTNTEGAIPNEILCKNELRAHPADDHTRLCGTY